MSGAFDSTEYANQCNAIYAVARNLATFDDATRERILMGVAVLYGLVPIIKDPAPTKRSGLTKRPDHQEKKR